MYNGDDPVIGYRQWYVVKDFIGDGVKLRSLTYPDFWPAYEPFVAIHKHGTLENDPDEIPHKDCSCGTYACKDHDQLDLRYPSKFTPLAVGQVSLWGNVYEHERGWRAEFAYPYSLEVLVGMYDAYEVAHKLSALYGVESIVRC